MKTENSSQAPLKTLRGLVDMKSVLITGGNGYIAQSLYTALKDVYDITTISRLDFDLSDSIATTEWFRDKYFDTVIHTAIAGGSRLRQDNVSVVDSNLKMYYNLLDNRNHFGKFINIGSGAELYHTNQPYGLSKYVIRQSLLAKDDFYNVRIFAVFDHNELSTRFIKANLLRYINRQPMEVDNNMRMDFFYMQDLISVMKYYIDNKSPLKEFNCTYDTSSYLMEIAEFINTLGSHTVDIKQNFPPTFMEYIGQMTPIGVDFIGLTKGITNVYNALLCKK